jgi:hypothetical protein
LVKAMPANEVKELSQEDCQASVDRIPG